MEADTPLKPSREATKALLCLAEVWLRTTRGSLHATKSLQRAPNTGMLRLIFGTKSRAHSGRGGGRREFMRAYAASGFAHMSSISMRYKDFIAMPSEFAAIPLQGQEVALGALRVTFKFLEETGVPRKERPSSLRELGIEVSA